MNLINKDALISDPRICGDCEIIDKCDASVTCFASGAVRRAIDESPIVEAVPVVTAHLEDTHIPIFKKCSNCGSFWSREIESNIYFLYCPRCGAKFVRNGDQL